MGYGICQTKPRRGALDSYVRSFGWRVQHRRRLRLARSFTGKTGQISDGFGGQLHWHIPQFAGF
jgi:hypothetical protein